METKPYGGVAQLGEHLPCKQGVMGSIPIISTSPEGRAARLRRSSHFSKAFKNAELDKNRDLRGKKTPNGF